jgi:hypothetical protein
VTSGVPNLYISRCGLCGLQIKDGDERELVTYSLRPGVRGVRPAHKSCAEKAAEDGDGGDQVPS